MPPGARRISSRVTGALLLAGGLLLSSSAAQAQLVRYVSATGNDANPCTSPAEPCRTLQRGITFAPTGGEVKLLTSVDGNATIDHSITISGGGFTVTGSIVINNANATVVLRDLHLSGAGSRGTAIWVVAASAVHIERCTVERFTENAVYLAAPNSDLFVTDSIVRDNGGPGITVYDDTAGPTNFGSMSLSVDNSRIANNGQDGLLLAGVAAATISRTVISGNRANGIASSYAAITITDTVASQNQLGAGYALNESKATLTSSVSRGNFSGLEALFDGAVGFVAISGSTFTSNSNVGIITSETVMTRDNNTVAGNGTDISGTLTPLPAY